MKLLLHLLTSAYGTNQTWLTSEPMSAFGVCVQARNKLRLKRSGIRIPIFVHVRSQRDERPVRHSAVSLLLDFEIGDRKCVVGILAQIRVPSRTTSGRIIW